MEVASTELASLFEIKDPSQSVCFGSKLVVTPIFTIPNSQTIWSSTKNLTSLAVAMLVDQKLLNFSDRCCNAPGEKHATNKQSCNAF